MWPVAQAKQSDFILISSNVAWQCLLFIPLFSKEALELYFRNNPKTKKYFGRYFHKWEGIYKLQCQLWQFYKGFTSSLKYAFYMLLELLSVKEHSSTGWSCMHLTDWVLYLDRGSVLWSSFLTPVQLALGFVSAAAEGLDWPLVANLCTYNFSAIWVSSEQVVKNDQSQWKEHVTGGCCECGVWCFATALTFTPLVLLADSLFPCHAYVLCLDTKAFNQQGLIYDFSERCNLRFLVESWKKLGVSSLSNHAGTEGAVIICTLLLLWQGSGFSTSGEVRRWQNTLTTPLRLLFLLHSSMSHLMSLRERTKWMVVITDRPDRGNGVH